MKLPRENNPCVIDHRDGNGHIVVCGLFFFTVAVQNDRKRVLTLDFRFIILKPNCLYLLASNFTSALFCTCCRL